MFNQSKAFLLRLYLKGIYSGNFWKALHSLPGIDAKAPTNLTVLKGRL